MTAYNVHVDMKPLLRFGKELSEGIAGAPGPIDDAFQRIERRFFRDMTKYFNQSARGGGDWPPLAESTKRSKRRKRRRRMSILIDTGTLRQAYSIGAAGNYIRRLRNGVRVGIGGGDKHSDGLTIGQLAMFHHNGMGNNPIRRLIPEPLPQETADSFARQIAQGVTELSRRRRAR